MIYLLEDDDDIRELVVYSLCKTGSEAKGFALPSEFFSAVKDKIPELAILDIMLPEQNGLDVLKKLRSCAETEKLPVIMLTAKSTEFDKVRALDGGADDYITKPFGVMELVARVKAVLRRSEQSPSQKEKNTEYSCGELFVSVPRHLVLCGKNEIAVTHKEFELLCYLLENRGRVADRDMLLNAVWGYDFDGENRTVDVHIRTLRQKLGECGELIETVRGVGYKIK